MLGEWSAQVHNGNLYCTVPSNLSYFQASPLNHSKLLTARLAIKPGSCWRWGTSYFVFRKTLPWILNPYSLIYCFWLKRYTALLIILSRKSGALYTCRKTQHLLKYSNSKEQTNKKMICRKTKPLLLKLIITISP